MSGIYLELLSFLMTYRVTPKKILRVVEEAGEYPKNNLEYIAPETVRVAAVQLNIHPYTGVREYVGEMLGHARAAAEAGAQMVVYPEYVGLLAGTMIPGFDRLLNKVVAERFSKDGRIVLHPDQVAAYAEAFGEYLQEAYFYTFSAIARSQHLYVVAGSCPCYEEGQIYNRSMVFDPLGNTAGTQDKTSALGLDEALGVTVSDQMEIVETPMGKVAVVLGSDAYYFECFRIARQKGARIVAVPDAGGGPVMHDLLRCRAQQEGLYLLHACLTGEQQKSRAAILAPFDITPDRNGILSMLETHEPNMTASRINLQKLENLFRESEPNRAFLTGDYLRSYRYSGMVLTPPELPG